VASPLPQHLIFPLTMYIHMVSVLVGHFNLPEQEVQNQKKIELESQIIRLCQRKNYHRLNCKALLFVNSRFLKHPQKRSCWNQLIHKCLTKAESMGWSQDPESQAGGQSDGHGRLLRLAASTEFFYPFLLNDLDLTWTTWCLE